MSISKSSEEASKSQGGKEGLPKVRLVLGSAALEDGIANPWEGSATVNSLEKRVNGLAGLGQNIKCLLNHNTALILGFMSQLYD